jgi:hypothetical protein
MSLLLNIASGLRSLFRKERVSNELDEELNGFLEMAAEEKMKHGMSRKDALRSAQPAGNPLSRRCGRICASPRACCASRPVSQRSQ